MKFDQVEYTIGEHFLSAIINDDYTGLSDNEERELNEWLEGVNRPEAHWDCDSDTETELAICEITGYANNCVRITQHIYKGV